jgi:TolA-binding protein
MKRIGLSIVISTLVSTAEPSVYGGGAGSSSYGRADIISMRQQISQMREEIEGLRSILNGLNDRLNRIQREKRSGDSSVEGLRELSERVSRLEKSLSTAKKSTSSKSPSKGATKTISSSKSSKKSSTATTSEDEKLKKASSSALYSRGVRLVTQKRYSEAKKRFDILLSRNYKPAASNFYLGEIAYYTGRYSDAIKHYQVSAERYGNAAYMDKLLLHTALSLEKTGNRTQAKEFFKAIIDGYPGTYSAKVAKKHLK